MPSIRVNKELNTGTYFITLTIKNWYYILDRYGRWDILAEVLMFYQKQKKIRIYSFVFMINHLHLVVYAEDVISFIRNFKSYTSKQIIQNIQETEPSILKLFKTLDGYELWEKTNLPKLIVGDEYFYQKVNYTHCNPVKRNYVMHEKDWYWSSANPYCRIKADRVAEAELEGSGETPEPA